MSAQMMRADTPVVQLQIYLYIIQEILGCLVALKLNVLCKIPQEGTWRTGQEKMLRAISCGSVAIPPRIPGPVWRPLV